MNIVPLNLRAEFMFVFIQYTAPSGFSSMDRYSQMKASRITEVLLSMAVFHGIFHSSCPNFILFLLKLLGSLKGAFKGLFFIVRLTGTLSLRATKYTPKDEGKFVSSEDHVH